MISRTLQKTPPIIDVEPLLGSTPSKQQPMQALLGQEEVKSNDDKSSNMSSMQEEGVA